MENKNSEHLNREIGIFGLSANIINIVIGAGIFVLPALVTGVLGRASIIAYLFCGLLITLIMLCFAEIGSKIIISGGAYSYIEVVLGRYPGFIAAFFFLLTGVTSDAAVANAVADVAGSLFPFMQTGIIRLLIFLIIFAGLGYINIIGVKDGVGFVKMITLAKIIPLIFILLIGTKDLSVSHLVWDSMPSVTKIGEASLLLFFAFMGAESALSVSGEVRHPQKTIPKAIFISIAFILFIYIFIQLISQAILGSALSGYTENTLGHVAGKIVGPVGLVLMTMGAGVSMFGNLSSEVLSIPRVLYAVSNDRLIPVKILSKIHSKFATPYVAIIVYAGLDFLFASTGGFKELVIVSSASVLLIYLGVAVAVIKLRFTGEKHSRGDHFRIPGGIVVPVLTVLVITCFLSNLKQNEIIGVAVFFVVLSIIYPLINFKKVFKK